MARSCKLTRLIKFIATTITEQSSKFLLTYCRDDGARAQHGDKARRDNSVLVQSR